MGMNPTSCGSVEWSHTMDGRYSKKRRSKDGRGLSANGRTHRKSHHDWRKLKLLRRQEFVVGGWTESERRPFRALLIGVYDDGDLRYVGRGKSILRC